MTGHELRMFSFRLADWFTKYVVKIEQIEEGVSISGLPEDLYAALQEAWPDMLSDKGDLFMCACWLKEHIDFRANRLLPASECQMCVKYKDGRVSTGIYELENGEDFKLDDMEKWIKDSDPNISEVFTEHIPFSLPTGWARHPNNRLVSPESINESECYPGIRCSFSFNKLNKSKLPRTAEEWAERRRT